MAFRYRDEGQGSLWQSVDYLNGSLSRIADWQKTEKIYEFLAAQAGLNNRQFTAPVQLTQNSQLSELKLYRLTQPEKKRELYCAHALRSKKETDGSRILIDVCLLPVRGKESIAQDNLNRLLYLFSQEEDWPSVFTAPVAVFPANKEGVAIELPALFFRVDAREHRSWFIDSAGLAEAEIFREPLSQIQSDEFALKIYDDSIVKILANQGNWSKVGDVLVLGKTRCLLFRKNEDARLVSYCHTAMISPRQHKTERITFLVIFPEELYDCQRLREWQAEVMNSWQTNRS